jgi:predicted DNA-binding transcriptional regulator YafY
VLAGKGHKMKINRLLEITILLLNRGSITAGELAERFQVSTRTVYRDVDVLSSAGVPVYTSKGSNGGIRLLENYALNKALINDQEIESLVFALKTLQSTQLPQLDTILEKIGAIFKHDTRADWVHIEFSPWGSGPNEDNKILNIKASILNRSVISFEYVNSQGGRSTRSIEPMQLVYKGHAWYLCGYCLTRGEFRTFRISRIKKLTITDRKFERRNSVNAHINWGNSPSVQDMDVKLRFRPEVIYRVYDDYEEEMISRNPDGTCDVGFSMPADEWLICYILSFGNHVEVIEPEYFREAIRNVASDICKIYKK